jgi:uncharacterized GH25 family protein
MRHRIAMVGLAQALSLCLGGLAFGHEFWIEPSAMRVAPGARIDLTLKVGHGADLTELPRNSDRFVSFRSRDAHGDHDIPGVEGASPAGILRPGEQGPLVLSYVSTSHRVELEAAKFERYLLEEGLERVIEERKAEGRSGERAVEGYSRCAKAIVSVAGASAAQPGEPSHVDVRTPIGLALELVPDSDPAEWTLGGSASLRLLSEGKPAANVLVRATAMDQFEYQRSARTDAEGRVRFDVAHSGRWRFNAVQMSRVESKETQEKDAPGYRSVWASLLVDVSPRAAAAVPTGEAPPRDQHEPAEARSTQSPSTPSAPSEVDADRRFNPVANPVAKPMAKPVGG